MKKIIALALVLGLTSAFAAGTPKSERAAKVENSGKTVDAKKVKKSSKAKKAKKAKKSVVAE
ncbi:MAG: hypothetical protein WC279_13915 [Sulfurimonas sp.]|jgi:hypothetical protein|uniref:hypothetical protein n=1 Tax=unclassified Sulfurimonas TaxID=2623549 RepID=UPI0008D1E092|nr:MULTISPECIES: hypothetical protein [unclassified Sulfurimonas]MBS4068224.1 hypothetical protein [Sulfurimonas sp.]MDD3855701.1 hypothetical protein [Sulfurimonas sp.]OHE04262.1 MAG: hypothetical protein A2345_09490 [Sulfurimonas sp. RIFOXYB12_FULL_35_9]